MHIEYIFQSIGRVSMQIRLECCDSIKMQIMITGNQRMKLLTNVGQLILAEFIMIELYFGLHKMLKIAFFLLEKE